MLCAPSSVTLDPGASATVTSPSRPPGLGAGQYEGFMAVTGATSGVESRVPYWYGVASGMSRRTSR